METEIASKADFTAIRYAQCWEDADVLLDALGIREGDTCLSIASAGDNAIAMLALGPARIVAVDLNESQLSCVRLRAAAYRCLEHGELLELIGSRESDRRPALYQRCRKLLDENDRRFWDAHADAVAHGIGGAGKFERYFATFRARVLPLIHSRKTVARLLTGGGPAERRAFYENTWNTWRWRLMFHLFFSRPVMGRLGRDPEFFRHVRGAVAARILQRAEHALIELNPADNPYLQWILLGRHGAALPFALRPENFDAIRRNIARLECRATPLESFLSDTTIGPTHRFNLSDIFEYMSPAAYEQLLTLVVSRAAPGARLAYWNMLAPRSRPDAMRDRLTPLDDLASRLHLADKAFFYSRFIVEEVTA